MTTPTDMDIVQAARLHIQTLRTIADLFESQLGLENPSESAGILHRQAAAEAASLLAVANPSQANAHDARETAVASVLPRARTQEEANAIDAPVQEVERERRERLENINNMMEIAAIFNQTVERMTYDANERVER